MTGIYASDLAFIHAAAFGDLANAAIQSLIPRLKAGRAQRFLDVGCGAGVSTRALVDAGLDTFAIEPSAALLELARNAAPAARFFHGSAYDVALPTCDAVLALGEALTYHLPSDDADAQLRGFFGSATAALPRGGQLVFDLIETGPTPLDARSWKSGPDWAVLSAATEDVEGKRLTREIETFRDLGAGYRRTREIHHVRLFERAAVVAWLAQAGFEVETATAYGALQLPPRRVAFFATRL
jgi:SAM-dependent methyltransferase